ncbi:MAG: hypothetical protein V4441_00670 [Pseudomonadota bacterium]
MAQATLGEMKKDAHHYVMQTRAFLRLLGRRLRRPRLLLAALVNLPALRRSRFYREGQWLWRRVLLVMSDGYNFEEFYRTQHGVKAGDVHVAVKAMDHLPSVALLSKAYDLSDVVEGMAAMRVLVERAVLKAQARQMAGRAVSAYAPKPHDPTIHNHWRAAIEEAFAAHRSRARPVNELPSFVTTARGKTSSALAPLNVANDTAFELSVPEFVPYRASTRH